MTGIENPPAPTAADGDKGGGGLVFIAMAGLLIALVATVVVIGLIGLLRDEDNGGAAGADGAAGGSTTLGLTLSEFKRLRTPFIIRFDKTCRAQSPLLPLPDEIPFALSSSHEPSEHARAIPDGQRRLRSIFNFFP